MSADAEQGRPGVGRVEAFSDGVIAIIVTIMVLELHPPIAERFDALWTLWPVFFAYALSFAYVAIYWANHHRLLAHATRVGNALVWSNMLLLFALSLVPFATAYLGEHRFSRPATWLYLVAMLLPAFAYTWLQGTVARTGRQDEGSRAYYVSSARKGLCAVGLYLLGTALTIVSPWLGIVCAGLVAAFWMLPSSAVDGWFVPNSSRAKRA